MLLDKASLSAVHAASTEKSRFALNGILLRKDRVTATDGRMIVEIMHSDANKLEEDFPQVDGMKGQAKFDREILPDDVAKQLLKDLPKKAARIRPILGHAQTYASKDNLFTATTDLANPKVGQPKAVDGTYPETDNVWPTKEPKVTVKLNIGLLKKLIKAVEACADPDMPTMLLEVFDKDTAIVVKVGDRCKAMLCPVTVS